MGRISQQVSGSALTATHASQGCDAWRSARQRPQADLWGSIPGLVNTPQLPVWRRSTQDGSCTSNDRPQRLAFKRLRSFDDCSSRAGYCRTLEETSAGFTYRHLFRISALPLCPPQRPLRCRSARPKTFVSRVRKTRAIPISCPDSKGSL